MVRRAAARSGWHRPGRPVVNGAVPSPCHRAVPMNTSGDVAQFELAVPSPDISRYTVLSSECLS
ncbi:hypothetical protein FAGKG844_1030005 [Frankia sp. AgKG'84/4]